MNGALKWKLVAGFCLVFLAGAMTGAWLWSAYVRAIFTKPPGADMIAHRMEERLRNQLDLTPEQFSKISPIVEHTAAQLESVRVESARRVNEVLTESHDKIALQLTPPQKAKLNEMESHRKRRAEMRGLLPPRRDGPPPDEK